MFNKGMQYLVNLKIINLWILTDEFGRIYYQGFSEESVNAYKNDNGFKDRTVVKLTGYLPQGEKNV